MNTPIQDPIAHACRLLREAAEELKSGHTLAKTGHDWTGEPEAKAAYDEHHAVADALERWESAIGAGGVEPLRSRQCLHKISEPSASPAAPLSEQDAGLLDQGVEMLEALANDERNRGNCSSAMGAECSAHAVRRLAAALLAAERAALAAPAAVAGPAYKDGTPDLHIGDSSFESWYSNYTPAHKGNKQRARDAYAAGMGDPLVTAAPAAVAGPVVAWRVNSSSAQGPWIDGVPSDEMLADFALNSPQASIQYAYAAPTTQAAPQLPERDASVSAEQQGLFRKFDVRRADGTDKPGGKHHGCRYFVLDVDHDPCAGAALTAYAAACEATHPALAADLRSKWGAEDAARAQAKEGSA